MGRTACAVAVMFVLLTAGCGGSAASSDDSGEASESFEVREASCDLTGSHTAKVTMVEEADSFKVTWDGQPVASTDTTGYFVTVFDEPGENGAQLGVNFLDGEPLAYFVSIEDDDPMVTNIDGVAQVDGDKVSAVFPKSAGSLGDIDVAQWNAAFTLAGNDKGQCPKGDEFLQPFPG